MTASPDSEWEASGIGEWGDERKEGDVGGEVTQSCNGAGGVEEGKTSCADDSSATAWNNNVA